MRTSKYAVLEHGTDQVPESRSQSPHIFHYLRRVLFLLLYCSVTAVHIPIQDYFNPPYTFDESFAWLQVFHAAAATPTTHREQSNRQAKPYPCSNFRVHVRPIFFVFSRVKDLQTLSGVDAPARASARVQKSSHAISAVVPAARASMRSTATIATTKCFFMYDEVRLRPTLR